MPRVVKAPEVRRRELLATAGELFAANGYRQTTVDAIIQKAGVAKGTFYYYFKNKQEILEALAHDLVVRMADGARAVAEAPGMPAMEKTRMIFGGMRQKDPMESTVMENLHQGENRELHERINIETILVFAPELARIVEQGVAEGSFRVEFPLETVQLLLSASQFLLDSGLFPWTPAEDTTRRQAMQAIVERALGAQPGSLDILAPPADR